MRERFHKALAREVTMPRWAILVDFFYRAFLFAGAIVVIGLWYQAATRDEEADRNARIQSCTSEYAATYSSWDSAAFAYDEAAEAIFARIIERVAVDGDAPGDLLARNRELTDAAADAAERAEELSRLRIGLATSARATVLDGNSFQCPPLPARLRVEGIDP